MSINIKKLLALIILPLLCTTLAHSQSLVELAKKEAERREKLKGNEATLVTNADLKKFNRTTTAIVTQAANSKTVKSSIPAPPQQIPVIISAKSRDRGRSSAEEKNELEKKYQEANEHVGLLTLKMRALWQQFYSMPDMTPKNQIQQQISLTYLQLQKAQEDAERLKKQLDTQKKNRK
jgi:hypothetical protein